jgi:hypothetical protein
MADFDVSFNNKNFDINLLFSEENIDIIRSQFQSDIIEPLFEKYKNFSDKIVKEIDRKTENKTEFNKHVDFIGIDQISKTRSKIKNDIINPFLTKLESFYDNLGKTLDENKNIKFLPKLDFSNINEKLEKKINEFENKIDQNNLEENISLKKRKETLKSRSPISTDKISDEIENTLIEGYPKKLEKKVETSLNDTEIKKTPEKVETSLNDTEIKKTPEKVETFNENLENSSNILDFMSEIIQNITILIEENALNRIVLENIKNDMFFIKTFTTDFFPNLDKILDDKLKNISGDFLKQNIPTDGELGSEQKKIGDQTPEISLSDDTIKKFSIMFNSILDSDKFKDFFKKFDFSDLLDKINPIKKEEQEDSFLMKVLKAALGLGLLMTLIPLLWDNYLKPWLEDFTGLALKKFDEILGRFEKPYETAQKWLVQSGLTVIAKTFAALGNLVDNTIGLITKAGSFIADAVRGAGSALKSIATIATKSVEKGAITAGSSVAGKVATEVAESSIEKGAITAGSSVAGKVATEVAEGAVTVTSSAATKSAGILSKLGGFFGKLSPRALSMIPFIGSFFNFGFALDDYQKGDYTSMGINLVSGLVNLVPGVGWIASLGLDVFNAILGFTTEGSTQDEINQNKSNKFNELLKLDKISNFIKNIPFLGWLASLGEGLDAAIAGDWETFFTKMDRVPQIGMITAPFKAFFDSTNVIDSVTGEKKSFSLETFTKELRKRMTRIYLSLIPSTFGMRSWVAEKLGVSEFLEENDVDASPDYSTETIGTDLQKAQNKAIENSSKPLDPNKVKYNPDTEKKLSEEYEKIKEYLKQNEETLKQLQQDPYKKDEIEIQKQNIDSITTNLIIIGNRLNEYRKLKDENSAINPLNSTDVVDKKESKDLNNSPVSTSKPVDRRRKARDSKRASKIQKADDFFENPMESLTNFQKYYYNPETDTKTYLNQNDAVYALQKGGIIEENINKQLEKFSETMMATLKEIQASGALIEKMPSIINAPVNNIMSSNVNNSNQDIGTITSGKRDPIFDARMDWWKMSSLERIV